MGIGRLVFSTGSIVALGMAGVVTTAGAAENAARVPLANIELKLGTEDAGPVRVVDGLPPAAEAKNNGSGAARSQSVGGKVEQVRLKVGAGLSRHFYDWLEQTAAQKGASQNVELDSIDASGKLVESRELLHAIVTEIDLPALDASSKDPIELGVSIAPESTRVSSGSGATAGAGAQAKQKPLLASHFTVEIDGVTVGGIHKVEPLKVTQGGASAAIGSAARRQPEGNALAVSHFVLYVSNAAAKPFFDWAKAQTSGSPSTKSAVVRLLSATGQDAHFGWKLTDLSVASIADDGAMSAKGDSVGMVKVDMVPRAISFVY